jgi:hypothetical protein
MHVAGATVWSLIKTDSSVHRRGVKRWLCLKDDLWSHRWKNCSSNSPHRVQKFDSVRGKQRLRQRHIIRSSCIVSLQWINDLVERSIEYVEAVVGLVTFLNSQHPWIICCLSDFEAVNAAFQVLSTLIAPFSLRSKSPGECAIFVYLDLMRGT